VLNLDTHTHMRRFPHTRRLDIEQRALREEQKHHQHQKQMVPEAEGALTEAMDASSSRDALDRAQQTIACSPVGLADYQAARRHEDADEALKRAMTPSPSPDMPSPSGAGTGRISPLSRELFPEDEHVEMVPNVPASVRLLP
jgi:hypothetical protein